MPAKKTAKIIDGKALSEMILKKLAKEAAKKIQRPGLAVIMIGDDPASKIFVKRKKQACHKIGVNFHEYLCGSDYFPKITEREILEAIDWLNKDPDTDGIVVQLPLPKKFNTQKIIEKIEPQKDVDGFHPKNKDAYLENPKLPVPPLIAAIKIALQFTEQDLSDKKTLIIADGELFSGSLKKALEKDSLKTTSIKSTSKKLTAEVGKADILISIVGKAGLITKEMIKDDAIVIDVGTTLVDGEIKGDVEPSAKSKASFFTPVPGGIGPLTVAMLLKNVVDAAK